MIRTVTRELPAQFEFRLVGGFQTEKSIDDRHRR
jgi:hypothetical protein